MLIRTRPLVLERELFECVHRTANYDAINQFEISFSNSIGGGPCIAMHQGRDALTLILKSLEIRTGDEIIIPNFICRVVADAIIRQGAVPVLVDCNLDDFNVSVDSIVEHISPRTKVVLVNHLYGIPCDIFDIRDIAKKRSIFLIEDCAQSLGSKIDTANVGSIGDFAFFSFNYDKPISTGLGGALLINNPDMISKVQKQAQSCKRIDEKVEKQILTLLYLQFVLTENNNYTIFLPTHFAADLAKIPFVRSNLDIMTISESLKINRIIKNINYYKKLSKFGRHLDGIVSGHSPYTMNSLRAAYALELLKELPAMNNKLNENALFYMKSMKRFPIKLPEVSSNKHPAFLRYTILNKSIKTREEIIKIAKSHQIELDYYNWRHTISQELCSSKIRFKPEKMVNSLQLVREIIHLPIHYYVNENLRDQVLNLFESIFKK